MNSTLEKIISGAQTEVTAARCAELAEAFVRSRQLRSLNVAAPRASKAPDAYAYAHEVVDPLLTRLGNGARKQEGQG